MAGSTLGLTGEAIGAAVDAVGAVAAAVSGGSTPAGQFRFEAGPYRAGEFAVEAFDGDEELSRPYRFEVTVAARGVDESTLEPALLGQSAALDFSLGTDIRRHVHGVVTAIQYLGTTTDDQTLRLRLRVEPRLALLKRNRTTRIFQEQTTMEIVSSVLAEAGITCDWRLRLKYTPRTYCVQYRESDWAFIRRLLAEDGVFFFFEQPAGLLSELLPGAAGDVAAAVGAVATAVSTVATGAVGAVADAVSEVLDPSELVVFADATDLYPAVPAPGAEILDDVVSTASVVADALGRPPVGTVLDLSSVAVAALAAVQTIIPSAVLNFHPAERTLHEEHHVTAFVHRRSLRPQAALLRDYDFRNPGLDLRATASALPSTTSLTTSAASTARRVVSAATTGGSVADAVDLPLALDPARFQVYSHQSDDESLDVSKRAAQSYLEQARRRAFHGDGSSFCRRLAPGYRFQLHDHPVEQLNREYVLTSVKHRGRTATDFVDSSRAHRTEEPMYRNEFGCAPATHPVRPQRVKRRLHQVLETAIVVGAGTEEIHTDEYGRVKVQFHWDLAGKRNDHSSCWLRVAQAWAGGGFGAQFVPRVGMEVLVGFLGGDEDRPHVMACLYNGANTPPFALPDDKSRSGLRTNSTPGGDGHNELSFEDKKGEEVVFLRAERDLDELVQNDHTVTVKRDEAVEVTRHQKTTVHGNRTESVAGVHDETIEQDRSLRVVGNQSHVSESDDQRWVKGALSWRIDGATRFQHRDRVDEAYLDDQTVRVTGCQTTIIGMPDALRHQSVYVQGTVEHYATGAVEHRSDAEILLQCGKSSILMGPESIEISSPKVLLHSTFSQVQVEEKAVNIRATEDLIVRGDKTAQLLGASITLTTPAAIQDTMPDVTPTQITLTDGDGNPVGNQRYKLVLSDGSIRTGFLDKYGTATLNLESGGEIQFPDMKSAT